MNKTIMKEETKTVIPPPRFANPFPGCLKRSPSAMRINAVIPTEVFNRVKQCRLESGTVQTTINLLWLKLVDALDKKGITGYEDVREFEQFVLRSVLVDGSEAPAGVAAGKPNAAAHGPDDRGRAAKLRSVGSDEPNERSDAASNTRRRGKRRGTADESGETVGG